MSEKYNEEDYYEDYNLDTQQPKTDHQEHEKMTQQKIGYPSNYWCIPINAGETYTL